MRGLRNRYRQPRGGLARRCHRPPRLLSLTATSLGGVLDDIGRIGEAIGAGAAAASAPRIDQCADAGRHTPHRSMLPNPRSPVWNGSIHSWERGIGCQSRLLPRRRRVAFRHCRAAHPLARSQGSASSRPGCHSRDAVRVQPRSRRAGIAPVLAPTRLLIGCRRPARTLFFAGDGQALFNRPGPRLVESLEVFRAESSTLNLCRFGHEGRFWFRFAPPARV